MTALPGSLHAEWVVCGKPTCRCARGARHGPYHRRFWREDGRTRSAYVRLADLEQTRAAVERWHFEHQSLRAAVRLFQQLDDELWDLLGLLGGLSEGVGDGAR